jgi:entry exclusion lipoprotein TrbK
MAHPTPSRALLLSALLALLLAACNNGPKTYDDCMLKASRQSQNDRQFKQMSEACKAEFPNR